MYALKQTFFPYVLFYFLALLPDTAKAQESDSLSWPKWQVELQLDSLELAIQINILTQLPIGDEYHWQIRVVHTQDSGERRLEKLVGLANLKKSVTPIYQLRQPLNSHTNLLIYAYLLDRDFIIDQLVWDLSEQILPKALQAVLPPTKPLRVSLAPDGFDLGGLVFNETRTRFGREFFSIFQQNWRPPSQTEAWWITIKEYPTPGRFTLISVSLNNRELFQRFLSPRRDQMEELVVYAIEVLQGLLSQGAIEGLFSEQDLHGNTIESKEIEEF